MVEPGLLELVDSHRRGDVVAEAEIELRHDQIARSDRLFAGGAGQYLLGHGHSHTMYPRSLEACCGGCGRREKRGGAYETASLFYTAPG